NADSGVTPEDNSLTLSVLSNDSDPDGDAISLLSTTQGTNGIVSISGSTLIYTPDDDFFGGDSFTYTISDGNGGTATAVVTVTVININDAPIATDDTASVVQNSTANVISVLGNDIDIDGDTLTVSAVTTAGNGTVVNGGGNVAYTPNTGFVGTDNFMYTVSDGNGGTATATVSINITP
ncbi:MAG: Ig-like domain-containing protein, partial [Candidatus Promineifilaceae bacterium]